MEVARQWVKDKRNVGSGIEGLDINGPQCAKDKRYVGSCIEGLDITLPFMGSRMGYFGIHPSLCLEQEFVLFEVLSEKLFQLQ